MLRGRMHTISGASISIDRYRNRCGNAKSICLPRAGPRDQYGESTPPPAPANQLNFELKACTCSINTASTPPPAPAAPPPDPAPPPERRRLPAFLGEKGGGRGGKGHFKRAKWPSHDARVEKQREKERAREIARERKRGAAPAEEKSSVGLCHPKLRRKG